MKRYLDFINESKNHEIISGIKDIIIEIEDSGLKVNYFYLDNHKSTFPSDEFNNVRIEIFSEKNRNFKIDSDLIDSLFRIEHYLTIEGYRLSIEVDQDYMRSYGVDFSIKSIEKYKGGIINRIILRVDLRINENLDFIKSSDFKNRWGIEGKLSVDGIYKYFDLFRDSLLELEDDGIIKKYTISYLKKGILYDRVNIKIDDKDIEAKITDFKEEIRQRASLSGKIGAGDLTIYTQFTLPIGDVTDIMSSIIDCVKFIKDNIGDNGECLLVPMSSTPNSFKIILNTKLLAKD
jgi:hypothetical protein